MSEHYQDSDESQQLPDTATQQQVDGDHYSKLKIQPLQLAYSLNASPCFCKLAKYLTRDKDDKLIQYNKALHCISLEKELIGDDDLYGCYAEEEENGEGDYLLISPHDYCVKIMEFSKQFKCSSLIFNALIAMYEKDYTKAEHFVKELMKIGVLF